MTLLMLDSFMRTALTLGHNLRFSLTQPSAYGDRPNSLNQRHETLPFEHFEEWEQDKNLKNLFLREKPKWHPKLILEGYRKYKRRLYCA